MSAAPAWLAAFHRKWSVARGRRIAEASRAFGCGWVNLLESAGLVGAEDQANAVRELERLEINITAAALRASAARLRM